MLLALTVHEFCHAYFALRMGDPTAYRQGRCSLNPLRHLEPLGTLCLMVAPIGWAKPVPVNPLNFRDRRKGHIIVSAAGPLSNVAQAVIFAIVLRALFMWKDNILDLANGAQIFEAASMMFFWGVTINVGLAVFNCLPLYPLDGFHIALHLSRPESQERFADTARFGPFAIMGLVMIEYVTHVDILGRLVRPPAEMLLRYVAGLSIG